MMKKTFLNTVGNAKEDILQKFLGLLRKTRSEERYGPIPM